MSSAARKLPPQPAPMSAADFLALGMAQTNVDALVEAGNTYGDDIDGERADLLRAEHPLQHDFEAEQRALEDGTHPCSRRSPTPER